MRRCVSIVAFCFAIFISAAAVAQSPSAPNPSVYPPPSPPKALGVQPANVTAATARNLIPDGTSISDNFSDSRYQWFVAQLERAKGYNFEALSPGDTPGNWLVSVDVYDADGTTPFSTGSSDCTQNQAAPSLYGVPFGYGIRCSIYASSGSPDRVVVTIRVDYGATGSYPLQVRLRENNAIARWTTNAYNMYVALQNNSSTPVSGFVIYYKTGTAGSSDYAGYDFFTGLAPYDATQFTHAAGSLPTNRGMMRVVVTNGTDVNAQAYAFNTTSGSYLFFTPEKPNHGGANSW